MGVRAVSRDDIELGIWFAMARNHASFFGAEDKEKHAKTAQKILAEWENRAARLTVHYGENRRLCNASLGTYTANIPDVTCSLCITELHREA